MACFFLYLNEVIKMIQQQIKMYRLDKSVKNRGVLIDSIA